MKYLPATIASLVLTLAAHPTRLIAESAPAFTGGKSAWHDGFERYDYLMDEGTLAIEPFTAPEGERFGVNAPAPGKRRCIVVAPRKAAPGNPWSWRGCYWDHEPQTEVELLKRGFHVAYLSADATLKPGKEWEAWYAFLTEKQGLSKKPAFVGMSRGGEYAYTWATSHPDAVGCIYADNPGGNREMLMKLGDLATRDVPLLHVCGSIDPLLGRFSGVIEGIYEQWGGRVTTMIKEGRGHHPHSLRDPKPIADWIERNCQPANEVPPAFVGEKFTKTAYYSNANLYKDFPSEGTFVTCRGPGFVECYARYLFQLPNVEGNVAVVVPTKVAEGRPWVYRSDFLQRDASVDQALLARGFHIVTGPVPYNADGPSLTHWNTVYQYLVDHGFSKKPVLEGRGGSAGDAYAWAIANAGKVSCLYAENPLLRSRMTKDVPLDHLAPLAAAGVPILHVCGRLDPSFDGQTKEVEKRYRDLNGKFTLIVQEGVGHYPLSPADPMPVVEWIAGNVR